ncbi:Mur ligase family protein [uncultured Brachyspira sp.]|uniref:bifunctional folylpolyglutamate synthase/dihydrofolate synthase n=1 Tax=uncultured Brachyspira sp. TaxID=221953 RepID=UPI0025DB8833|nr:Mur ligase family protein [uncultured Brachyspira sp.]
MNNIKEAKNYIYSFMGKKTLNKNNFNHINNVKEILKILGYNQTFKVIHITGTKGKGSTALTLSKMLSSLGYKSGAFTSPHIIDERERISVNEKCISDEYFINITLKIKNIIDSNEIYNNITVFEIFTIMGLYYFYINALDYACIEVGIGGKLDCTNIVNSSISILTSISYDHMEILGYSIEEITEQKAGIIKPNTAVISSYQEEKSIKIIKDISKENNCILYIYKEDFDAEIIINSNERLEFIYKENNKKYNFSTSLLGEHQAENISLSFKALNLILKNENNYTEKNINKAVKSLKDFHINARLTFLQKNPDIIVDGAHNSKSLERVLNTVYEWYDDIIILFAPLSQKDIKNMSSILKKYNSKIIVSSPDNISHKETDSYKTYKYLKNNALHIPNFYDAVKNIKMIDKPVLVIGSLYAAGEFINIYKNSNITD